MRDARAPGELRLLPTSGDTASAVAAAARALGMRLPRADYALRRRDPRQDMQYGESLRLGAHAITWRRARVVLARARQAWPGESGSWLASGAVETALGEFPKAMTFLDRAARSAPRSSWVRAWRGVSRSLDIRRRRRGDLRQALKDLDAAMKLGASAQFVAPWRAELRHDLDDREGALADLALIAPDHDSHLWARVERGEILCELGRTPEALSEFNRLTRENPGAAWAWALRGRTKATTGRAREGLRDLDRAVKLAPRSAAARAWRSEALRLLGRYRLALRDLDCAVRRDPRYTLAWIWRGRLRLVRGQAAPALRDFNRALSLDERYRLAFAWRAEALFKLGRMKAAVRDMREAAPLDLSRTWNSVSREGELAASARREASYWSDLQECLRSRAADRWARAFVRAALKTGPAPAEPRQ